MRFDMRCTCCSKLTDGTKAETNASLQDLTLLMVCLQFEKFDFIYQNQQRSLENRITFGKLTSTDEASLWLEPNWGCTEGVWGVLLQKPPSVVSAWCCSPWPIVSLDYWIIRGRIMSIQKTCLSTVFECLANFLNTKSYLISAGIHLEGGTFKKICNWAKFKKNCSFDKLKWQ